MSHSTPTFRRSRAEFIQANVTSEVQVHETFEHTIDRCGRLDIAVNSEATFDTHCFAHYLHHKHFECNYADGAIPLDKWFGTFHDGSQEAAEAMKARFLARAQSKRGAPI
jgi:sterol desaturase/sphingolipid hydroxylase (fatty acid hydroxylase superfamily)